MRTRTEAIRATVLGLLAAVGLGSCSYGGLQDLPLPGSPDVGEDPYVVHAEFRSVMNLARKSTVRLDGVTVGRVEDIRLDGWRARVTLLLQGDVDVPADVEARIAQTSLLGEKFVALEPPARSSSRELAAGSVIPTRDTSRGREVEEVLGALALLLNGGGVGQLQTITAELKDALADVEGTSRFIGELDQLVTTLDRNRAAIIDSLEHVSSLSRQLSRERRTVARSITSVSRAVEVLAGQREEITTMLRSLDGLSQVSSRVVRRTAADLDATLAALRPVLAQLDRAGKDVPRVLETVLSFPFPDKVLESVHGDYVNLDVLMDLTPLVVAGNTLGDDEQLQDDPLQYLLEQAPEPPLATNRHDLDGVTRLEQELGSPR